MTLLVGALLALSAFAQDAEEGRRPWSIAAGVGNHYGLVGVAGTWRPVEWGGITVGAGYWGLAAQAQATPIKGFRPLYIGLGYAPHAESALGVFRGPSVMVGLERAKKRLHLRGAVGAGSYSVLGASQPVVAVDAGIGVNLGGD